jgi:signal transduction histidine kinase
LSGLALGRAVSHTYFIVSLAKGRKEAGGEGGLQALTDAALAHLDLDALLRGLLARTKELLRADTCAILLLDSDRDEVVATAAVGIEEEVEQGVRIPLGRGFAGRVAAERRPILIPDVDSADIFNPILREKRIKSLLGAPLVAHDELLGVMHVGTLTRREFDAHDVECLELAAERAAIAISHARLFEAERDARQRLEALQSVTDIALSELALDELLSELLPRIRQIIDADTCAVLLLDETNDELVARAAVGIEEEVEAGVRIPVGDGFAGRVAASKQPVILDDVDHAHVLNPILREKGIKSLLGVPLLIHDTAIGVLHVGTLTPRHFTRGQTELLQLVAERVALAIERAQLHQEMLRLDELRANFVAIASHELRTPATSVVGAIATIVARGDTLTDETRNELLQVAHAQGQRLAQLLEQLLDLSRLSSNRITVNTKPLVLRGLLEQIAADSLPPETLLQLEVPGDLAAIADPLALDRIVSNLLTNAAAHGAPPIVLYAEQQDTHLRISVTDHGNGVAADATEQLFEQFSRGQTSKGAGLGLAIARAYARAHGGELLYHPSENRFELVLPNH